MRRSKVRVAVSIRSSSGTMPRGRARSTTVRPSAPRTDSTSSGTSIFPARSIARALSSRRAGSSQKGCSVSNTTRSRGPRYGGRGRRSFSAARAPESRKIDPFSMSRSGPPGVPIPSTLTRQTNSPGRGSTTRTQLPVCGSAAGMEISSVSRRSGGPLSRRISARAASRTLGSKRWVISTPAGFPAPASTRNGTSLSRSSNSRRSDRSGRHAVRMAGGSTRRDRPPPLTATSASCGNSRRSSTGCGRSVRSGPSARAACAHRSAAHAATAQARAATTRVRLMPSPGGPCGTRAA